MVVKRSDARFAVLALVACAYVVVMVSHFQPLPATQLRGNPIAPETAAAMAVARTPAVMPSRQAGRVAVDATPAPMAVAAKTAAPTEAPKPTVPPQPTTAMRGRRTRVFIVNLVDSARCGETLQSLFEQADAPELLRVSVHDQIREARGDLPCVEEYCQRVGERACRRSQIISTQVDADDAKGPTVARAITERSLGDEEFCLGLDSHLVFAAHWDTKAVTNWEATENPNAILTTYPKSVEYMTNNHGLDGKMGVMCKARIEQPDPDTMIQYQPVDWIPCDNTTKPRLHSQFAGGFNFGSCQAYRDVPNDPYTPILFYGEEYVRAARLWTHGYDMYGPSVDIVYHYFEARMKIWDQDWSKRHGMMARSKRRVRFMMGLPVTVDDFDHTDLDKYGLGKKRTFEQWKKFSGIDPLAPFTDKTRQQFINCGELKLVPFNEETK